MSDCMCVEGGTVQNRDPAYLAWVAKMFKRLL